VAKVNINSSLRLAYKKELAKAVKTYEGLKAYELLSPVVEAVVEQVNQLFSLLPKIK
jgi:fructose/tagatose bisphosphate aldolase